MIFFQQPPIPSVNHFFHRGKVVRPFYCFYIEMPVVFLAGFTILKNHTSGYGIGSLNVGIVKTFNMPWLNRQTQVSLHLFHNTVGMLVGIGELNLFETLHTMVFGIAFGQIQNMFFIPQFGYSNFYFFTYFNFKRHINFLGFGMKPLAYFGNGQLQ